MYDFVEKDLLVILDKILFLFLTFNSNIMNDLSCRTVALMVLGQFSDICGL